MKRTATFLLMLTLITGITLPAGAAGPCTLPEPLKTVPAQVQGLSLPPELPPYVEVTEFSVGDDGSVHVELEDKVPRLKILEQNLLEGVDSTIYSKKNTSTGDGHMFGKENSVFTVRMIWPFGNMEYSRDYSDLTGSLSFVRCTATEEADPGAFAPYTSAVRKLTFNERGLPTAETWTLENEKDRFTRIASFGIDGKLRTLKQTWESVNAGEYKYAVETDGDGVLTSLSVQDKKNSFFAQSLRISDNQEAMMLMSVQSLDSNAFDAILIREYPQLYRGLIDYDSVDIADVDDEFLAMWNTGFGSLTEPQVFTEPATMTDLWPSTMTDLWPATMTDLEPATMTDLGTATMTDLPAIPDEELTPIPANARIWSFNFGTIMDSQVYCFVSLDPLLALQGGKVVLNRNAKDVNGNAVRLKQKIPAQAMELPAIE